MRRKRWEARFNKFQDAIARRLKYLTRVLFRCVDVCKRFSVLCKLAIIFWKCNFFGKVRKCALCVLIFILLLQLSGKLNSFYGVADSQWCMTKVVVKKCQTSPISELTAEPNAISCLIVIKRRVRLEKIYVNQQLSYRIVELFDVVSQALDAASGKKQQTQMHSVKNVCGKTCLLLNFARGFCYFYSLQMHR